MEILMALRRKLTRPHKTDKERKKEKSCQSRPTVIPYRHVIGKKWKSSEGMRGLNKRKRKGKIMKKGDKILSCYFRKCDKLIRRNNEIVTRFQKIFMEE